MRKAFFLASLTSVLILFAGSAMATPDKGICSGCHGVDPDVRVSVTSMGCNNGQETFEINVSDTYDAGEGWAVFSNGTKQSFGYGTVGITALPDGNYEVWGVSDSDLGIGGGKGGSNMITVNPDCGGSSCTDEDGDKFFLESGCGTLPDCVDTDATVNPGVREDCTDNIDNDCDQLIDGEDPDCGACVPTAAHERGKRCSDGIDNDCDGGIDSLDPDDCKPHGRGGAVEICNDGVDNDGDRKIDCDDRKDCRKDPVCQ